MNNSECKCALKITHIGEELLAFALNDKANGLMKDIAGSDEYIAVPEAAFSDSNFPAGLKNFDGCHKIDVLLVPLSSNIGALAIPIELKLGKTRMAATKSEFGRFLSGYKYNKKTKKFSGSMISILGEIMDKENNGCKIKYPLTYDEKTKISQEWKLIVLTKYIREELDQKKEFWSCNKPQIFSFQELFENRDEYIQRQTERLIFCKSYYYEWLKKE